MTHQTGSNILKNSFRETMQSRILSGELKPGDRLPAERELAKEMGISRGSVNQGILDLERMGFLRVVPRKGTYVAEYVRNATPQTLAAIMSHDSALVDGDLFRDLMSMRILIERECVRLACRNMNESNMQTLESAASKVAAASYDALVDALYDYHHTLVDISGNAAYALIFQSFELMLRNMIRVHYKSEHELRRGLPLYEQLSSSIENRNEEEADRLILSILTQASDYLNSMLKR